LKDKLSLPGFSNVIKPRLTKRGLVKLSRTKQSYKKLSKT